MMRDGGRAPYANDGGQAKKWEWTADNLPDWKKKQAQFERGSIIAYANSAEYLYIAADCAAAYAPSKLKTWTRQIVFLRPHTFVIYDRVVSARPEYEKTWLLHSGGEPQVDGTTTVITKGKGRLTAQTLLPPDAKINKVYGYGYRGQTFDPPKNPQSNVAPKWRLEVQPALSNEADEFLHVLSTATTDGVIPPTQLIRAAGQVGAKIGDTQILFSANAEDKAGGTLVLNGQTYELKREVRVGQYER
jgi:hypothetical protein